MDKQPGCVLCFHCGEDLRQSNWARGTYHGHKYVAGVDFDPPSEEYVQTLDSNNELPRVIPHFQELPNCLNLCMLTTKMIVKLDMFGLVTARKIT